MCPHPFDLDFISSWDLFIILGIIAAVALYIALSIILKIDSFVMLKNLVLVLIASAAGFASGVGFQALYDFIKYGAEVNAIKWEPAGGIGITFLGGLFGGVAVFILLSILTKETKRDSFLKTLSIILASVTLAHALGRIGCFMAGCCYGIESELFGMTFISGASAGKKVLPTQLYESIALFILLAAQIFIILRTQKSGVSILTYLFGYAVFRFILEFFRGDYRGGADIFLSPTQVLCIIMTLVGAILLIMPRPRRALI